MTSPTGLPERAPTPTARSVGRLQLEPNPVGAPAGSGRRSRVPGRRAPSGPASAAQLCAGQGRSRELGGGRVGAGWGEHSPTPYFCLLVGIQRAMAATSPRGSGGGGGGGYSSQGSGCHRAALLRAPDSSAMFRQTSPGPARRLLAALPAIRSGSSPGPRSPAGPGGRAAVRAPPGAAPAPPAGRALRPPRPPPRPDPRAPGLSRRPAPDTALSPAGAGSASRTSREQFPSTDWGTVFSFWCFAFFPAFRTQTKPLGSQGAGSPPRVSGGLRWRRRAPPGGAAEDAGSSPTARAGASGGTRMSE